MVTRRVKPTVRELDRMVREALGAVPERVPPIAERVFPNATRQETRWVVQSLARLEKKGLAVESNRRHDVADWCAPKEQPGLFG